MIVESSGGLHSSLLALSSYPVNCLICPARQIPIPRLIS